MTEIPVKSELNGLKASYAPAKTSKNPIWPEENLLAIYKNNRRVEPSRGCREQHPASAQSG